MKRIISNAGSYIEKTTRWSGIFGALFIVMMAPLVTYEVVLRYVFRRAPMVADEFSAYMLVTCTFVGLAYAMQTKAHVRVEVVVNIVPPNVRNWLRLITLIGFLAYAIIFLQQSWKFVLRSIDWGLVSETHLMTPEWIPQVAMPVGFALLILYLLLEIVRVVKTIMHVQPPIGTTTFG